MPPPPNLDSLYVITSLSDMAFLSNMEENFVNPHYIDQSLVIFSVGFLFKVGGAPFNFLSQDVCYQIATIVTTFVAIEVISFYHLFVV